MGIVTAIGAVFALVFIGFVFWLAWLSGNKSPDGRPLTFLVLLFGALLGWATGMLLSPVNPNETAVFPEFGKAIVTLLTGYVAAKLDLVFGPILGKPLDEQLVTRFLLFGSGFLLAVIATFGARSYIN